MIEIAQLSNPGTLLNPERPVTPDVQEPAEVKVHGDSPDSQDRTEWRDPKETLEMTDSQETTDR